MSEQILKQKFLVAPQELMNNAVEVYKNDAVSTVVRIMHDGQPYIIKRYNKRSLWYHLKNALRASRARRNIVFAHRLHQKGIKTIEPLALLEHKVLGVVFENYLLMRFIAGVEALDVFGVTCKENELWPRQVKAIAQLIIQLGTEGFAHKDLNLSNIKLQGQHAALLDLDSMQYTWASWLSQFRSKRNIQRFLGNWSEQNYAHPDAYPLFVKALKTSEEKL